MVQLGPWPENERYDGGYIPAGMRSVAVIRRLWLTSMTFPPMSWGQEVANSGKSLAFLHFFSATASFRRRVSLSVLFADEGCVPFSSRCFPHQDLERIKPAPSPYWCLAPAGKAFLASGETVGGRFRPIVAAGHTSARGGPSVMVKAPRRLRPSGAGDKPPLI